MIKQHLMNDFFSSVYSTMPARQNKQTKKRITILKRLHTFLPWNFFFPLTGQVSFRSWSMWMLSRHILIIVTLPNLLLIDRIQRKNSNSSNFTLLLLPLSRRENPEKLEKFLCNIYCCGSISKWNLKMNVLISCKKNVHLCCTRKTHFFSL